MTREEAINRIKDHMDVHGIGEYPHIKLAEALDMAISAIRAQQEQERNDPLTLDEIRRMDGEPVWISSGGFWALVNTHSFGCVALIENSGETVKADGWMKHMGAIYRRKPEEVSHEND